MKRIDRYLSILVLGGLIFSTSAIFANGAQEQASDTPEYIGEAEKPEAAAAPEAALPQEEATESDDDGLALVAGAGVVITDVVEDSAAAKAGLLRGDVILSVNGTEVVSVAGITDSISGLSHGDAVTLAITRGGEDMEITLNLETRIGWPLIGIYGMGQQESQGQRGGMMNNGWQDLEDLFGRMGGGNEYRWEDMTPGNGLSLRFDENFPEEYLDQYYAGNAVIVTDVVADSPAAAGGITAGAVILDVDGKEVADGDLKSVILSYTSNDEITLTVYQDEEVSEITITLGDADGNPSLGVYYHPAGEAMMQYNNQYGGQGNMMPQGFPRNNFDRQDG